MGEGMARLKLPAAALMGALFATAVSGGQTSAHAAKEQEKAQVHEDHVVRIVIPAGWSRVLRKAPDLDSHRVGGAGSVSNSVAYEPVPKEDGRLVLQKDGYTLAIGDKWGHASGAVGGRFIEAFDIPWLDADQAVGCGGLLREVAQPADQTLIFQNLILDTGVPEVRTRCGIPKDLSEWVGEGAERRVIGEQRWFGGYFTTGVGWFFDEQEANCQAKLYTLTSGAKTPAELPAVGDARLKQIIRQAIEIVDSIHYKRCAPQAASPF